jgi:hypothetical protein
VELISQYDFVVGCAAWFTSWPIAHALSKVQSQIVVQKEDFLRPDMGARPGTAWAHEMRSMYNMLRCKYNRYDLGQIVGGLSMACDPTVEPVRCVGNHNAEKKPAFPRMHHKFLVFCKVVETPRSDDVGRALPWLEVHPKAVWTGSFNLTRNSGRSLENVVVIESEMVAGHYYDEWQRVFAISEPLDWQSPWCLPEYRLGT